MKSSFSIHQFYAEYTKEHSYKVWFKLVKYFHRKRFLKVITLKIVDKYLKGAITLTWLNKFMRKFDQRQISSC